MSLLAELEAYGFRVRTQVAETGEIVLVVSPGSCLTPRMRAEITQHKAEVVAQLQDRGTRQDVLPLGDLPSMPPHNQRDTSIEAAQSVIAHRGGDLHRIAEYLQAQGLPGATCDEVELALGMTHQTASARVHDLMRMDVIQDVGRRRPTRSGRQAIAWRWKS